MLPTVTKRDGRVQDFDREKVFKAVLRCISSSPQDIQEKNLEEVADRVTAAVVKKVNGFKLTVEQIQDLVEATMMEMGLHSQAKAYILYRNKKAELRKKATASRKDLTAIESSDKYFPDELSKFVFYRSYSRWIPELNRRETWEEAVDRVINYYKKRSEGKIEDSVFEELKEGILNMEAFPSMRAFSMAGPALDREALTSYNCSAIALDSIDAFAELLYVLCQGTGVGFSVEYEFVDKLPRVKFQKKKQDLETFVIPDSTEGWCDALKIGMQHWFNGKDILFDYSQIRPAGARLKVKGGRASGSDCLKSLLEFTRNVILSRQGDRLQSIHCYDIACYIAQVVVAGSIRRSATISLSDLDDELMRDAKKGQFWIGNKQRSMSNNSAVYTEKPTSTEFMREWLSLAESGTGERGIYNRQAANKTRPKRRKPFKAFPNPCGEVQLRNRETCNLSTIVVREHDTEETLLKKIRLAAIFGTIQATFTNFNYVSSEWKENAEEERLLGVSMTGQLDNPIFVGLLKGKSVPEAEALLRKLKEEVIKVNLEFSEKLGINPSVAVTAIKPEGTTSIVCNASSGAHPRFSRYYIRRIRVNAKDPLYLLCRDAGVPCYPEVGEVESTASTFVLEFPVKAPEGCLTVKDITALEQLEYWLSLRKNYAEHSVSCSIYVSEDEWFETGNWVYNHFDEITGLSFFPRTEHQYYLAPYSECTEEEYLEAVKNFPKIPWHKLTRYELEDNTSIEKEFSCSGGSCDLI